MEQKKQWSREDMLLLIDLFKEKRCLWDTANEEYTSKKKRKECRLEIANYFNVDTSIIKTKTRSIIKMFRVERNLYNKEKIEGRGSEFRSRWYAFEKAKFLLDVGPPPKREKQPRKKRPPKEIIPSSLIKFFIKQYCKKRKDGAKLILMEATKSWTTLSETEKEHFAKKYEMCKQNQIKKQANYLDKKTKPYLKKKNLQRPLREVNTLEENTAIIINNQEDTEDIVNNEEKEHSALHDTSHNIAENESPVNVNNLDNASECSMDLPESQSLWNNHSIENTGILAEPTPPNVRTGRELFNMIRSNRGENLVWDSLSNAQKRHYQKAVTTLKYSYILKFKAYLESLPSKDLFNYYNNYF